MRRSSQRMVCTMPATVEAMPKFVPPFAATISLPRVRVFSSISCVETDENRSALSLRNRANGLPPSETVDHAVNCESPCSPITKPPTLRGSSPVSSPMMVLRREVSSAVPVPSTWVRGRPERFHAYHAMTSTGLETMTMTPLNPDAMTRSTTSPTSPMVKPSSSSRVELAGGLRPTVMTTMSESLQSP